MTPENAATWRDIADQLTPEQIAGLERSERDLTPWTSSVLLSVARQQATENLLAIINADVPLPAGVASVDDWQPIEPLPYRHVGAGPRTVTDHDLEVLTNVVQFADGSIDGGGQIEPAYVYVFGLCERGPLNSAQARELAPLLLAAASELDGWTTPSD